MTITMTMTKPLTWNELCHRARHTVAIYTHKGLTLTCAESCTGGLVAGAITSAAGASRVLNCAFVTYSNGAKQAQLDVPFALLDTCGAVSAPVAVAMAEGALKAAGADVAIALTGIAGPDGGSPAKPVGLVHLCVATLMRSHPVEKRFGDLGRTQVRYQAVATALDLLNNADIVQSAP